MILLDKAGANIDRAWNFYYYSSPLTVIISICFLYLFVSSEFRNRVFSRIFTWISTVSLGIYIIHAHPYSLDHILIGEKLEWIVKENPLLTLFMLLVSILAIIVVTGLLEQIRMFFFKTFGIDKISIKIGSWMDMKLNVSKEKSE